MTTAWRTLDRVETPDGELALKSRGDRDFLITLAGRVLMNSRESRSERALASLALAATGPDARPRLLIGGLGMGCTLRAALDRLPQAARVEVSELNAQVVRWCAGPLAAVNGRALADPRVEVRVEDVGLRIASSASAGDAFDVILLDLYEGPHAGTDRRDDPFYGSRALERTRRALAPGGTFALWSEAPDAAVEERLRALEFEVERRRPGRGGRRHCVIVARRRRSGREAVDSTR
jgi:spermidine synthase